VVLSVNGERQEVQATTIASLLAVLGYEGTFFAVARNGDLVRKADWAQTPIDEDDRIEIVTPRQGG
jgi:sulfur carrier protein